MANISVYRHDQLPLHLRSHVDAVISSRLPGDGLIEMCNRHPGMQFLVYVNDGLIWGLMGFTLMYNHPNQRFLWIANTDPRSRNQVHLRMQEHLSVEVCGVKRTRVNWDPLALSLSIKKNHTVKPLGRIEKIRHHMRVSAQV